jgi:MerR family transcriptional regulator, mercuric resistance operon regulatory protein
MAQITIGTLARQVGVGVETIRYYQRRGLLDEPAREGGGISGGIRRYGTEHLQRLRFIRSAQTAGFTLEEIGRLLELDAGHDREEARQMARTRIAALDLKIAELQEARQALTRLSDACGATEAGPCPILASFEPSMHSQSQ